MTNNTPFVTVIIPVYNQQESFLRQCIESILSQDYQNFELIISDNYSNNGSWEVINSFTHPKIQVIRPPQHLSMVQHWSFAAFHAKGEYLSIMGSDDWAEPNWLSEIMGELVKHSSVSFAFSNLFLEYHKEGTQKPARKLEISTQFIQSIQATKDAALWTSHLFSWWIVGAVIKTKDYFDAGGISRYATTHNGDYPLCLGLLSKGDALYVSKLLVHYRIWGEEDGKADASRLIIICEDMLKIVSCIKVDYSVRLMCQKSGWPINKIRKRLLRMATIWVAFGMIKTPFALEDAEKIENALAELMDIRYLQSFRVKMYLNALKFYLSYLNFGFLKAFIKKLYFKK